jgi:CPA2 family monovalent cation:H+ antiporter-2
VRRGEPLTLYIEHRLPKPLRTFVSLYGTWFERLGLGASRAEPRPRLARLAGLLVLDVLCFAGVVIGTSLFLEKLAPELGESAGLPHGAARTLVLLCAAAVAAPFAVGIVRLARVLGRELAAAALPHQEGGEPDFAAAPRRAFVVALQLAAVILVGGPLLALTQPFVPVLYEASVVLVGLAVLTVAFWRRANALEAHVRAGAQVVVEALQRQNPGEDEAPTLHSVQPLLPGLGDLTPLRVGRGSPAVGRTLASLDLRARTGASVIAITRDGRGIITPTGRELLHEGDVLALAGSSEPSTRPRSSCAPPGTSA